MLKFLKLFKTTRANLMLMTLKIIQDVVVVFGIKDNGLVK